MLSLLSDSDLKMKYVFSIALFSLFFSLGASKPPAISSPSEAGLSAERLERVSFWLDDMLSQGKMAGSVTFIARKGKLAHFEARGFADIEAERPMEKDTIFALASMTKPVTAVAVLMLVEEGKILLSDPVEKFIPAFGNPMVAVFDGDDAENYTLVPANRSITILDLLTHRAGLPGLLLGRNKIEEIWGEALSPLYPGQELEVVVDAMGTLPLSTQPGTEWKYGFSTTILGRVVEVASGLRFEEFLQKRIFDRLEMVDTGFSVPIGKRDRLASIYRRNGDGVLEKMPERFLDPAMHDGGGGLFSTAPDYLKFCQMLLNGGELNGERILSPMTIRLMTTPIVDKIPLPFLRGQSYGLTVAVLHPGGEAGLLGSPGTYGWSGAFNTYFRIDPEQEFILGIFQQTRPGNDLETTYGFQNVAMSAIVD